MKCPVCDNVNTSMLCPKCGFDSSRDYEKYPTFGPVGKGPAVSALQREWGQGNPPPPEKKPWLAIAVCAAIFALGIGIGAGLGGGKEEPTEPVVTTTAPPETTILPETTEPPETTIPPETTEQTEPREIWETNVLMSDTVLPHGDYYLSVEQLGDGSYDCSANYRVLGLRYRREQIKTVTFVDTLAGAPHSAWDVSELKNGAVMAWVKPNGELFDLYIGAEGGVWANESCSDLFLGYCNLEKITFGGAFHTENAQYMSHMFYGCYKLKELDLSSFDTSDVETMFGMFRCCWDLEKVDLSSFDTSQVEYMDKMFFDCQSLKDVVVSSFVTSNVKSMMGMFWLCSALKELDLSSFDTGNVQDMSCMFWGCEVLTELNLDGFDTSNVQDMSSMFRECYLLKKLDLRSFDTSSVQDMGCMFQDSNRLTNLMLGDRFVTENADIMGIFGSENECPAFDDWGYLLN